MRRLGLRTVRCGGSAGEVVLAGEVVAAVTEDRAELAVLVRGYLERLTVPDDPAGLVDADAPLVPVLRAALGPQLVEQVTVDDLAGVSVADDRGDAAVAVA